MAKFDIREFNYITSGKAQNTFNVSFCYTDDGMIQDAVSKPPELSILHTKTFFGDIGEYQTMSQKNASNKLSFYDKDNKTIIHNLYEVSKTKLKSTSTKRIPAKYGATEKIDIFCPQISDDFIYIAQFSNYAYGLTKSTLAQPMMLSIQMNDMTTFDSTYHYVISNDTDMTFLSPKPQEICANVSSYTEIIDSNPELSNYLLSTVFRPKISIQGVYHNYVVEIPEGESYNDYMAGYIQADVVVAKNHLNNVYTLSADSNRQLSGCREYCNINVCGGQLYMTYIDNMNYQKVNGTTTKYNTVDANGTKMMLSAFNVKKVLTPYTYQHIEVIDAWNRYDGQGAAKHKSSMFSLKLIDTGLNSSTINEAVKTKLRQNIMNNIRNVIDKIVPANTQLFNIYFEGK